MSIPIKNISRDPALNWQINPARNWQINPARNWQINPARNWQINPARNWQINPARTHTINPFVSQDIPGKYLIDCETGTCEFYMVPCVGTMVFIVYDDNNVFRFFCVGIDNHFSIFDQKLTYRGYLASNSCGNYNWFGLDGKWVYYTV